MLESDIINTVGTLVLLMVITGVAIIPFAVTFKLKYGMLAWLMFLMPMVSILWLGMVSAEVAWVAFLVIYSDWVLLFTLFGWVAFGTALTVFSGKKSLIALMIVVLTFIGIVLFFGWIPNNATGLLWSAPIRFVA